jgi:UDP:flavonoid glycosyltransferase YjiC (YdhE family)
MSSSLNVLLTPVGSGGDVYPYVGIGRELRRRGHRVTLLAAGQFRSAAEAADLEFVEYLSEAEFDRITENPDLWHQQRGIRLVFQLVVDAMPDAYQRLVDLYQPNRTVVVGHTLSFPARVFEETHDIRAATIHLAPATLRTLHLQPAYDPARDLTRMPKPLKRLMWWIVDRVMIDPYLSTGLNRWRRQLGLPPVSRPFKDWMNSPQGVIGLWPEWFGPTQPDWPPQARLAGFPLFDDADARPPSEALNRFISSGDAPVVFAPGTANQHAAPFFAAASEATARLGRRAVFLTAYPNQLPDPLPQHVHHEAYAPFSQVLPRCAGLVHHGGIGTCSQGLAAGIPQVVMPMGFDQPDNAVRLSRLGVGTWVRPRQFTGARLARALNELLDDPAVRGSCSRWREEIASSRTIPAVADLIEGGKKTT